MRLFIAEKPSLGKAIAQFLPGAGSMKSSKTHIECGDDVVTWCFGHLLEQAPPEEYDEAYKNWSFDTLPIIPPQWKLLEKDSAKDQIKAIKGLLAKASSVVNAGDPDREGQLLVDELLEHLGNKKPVKRIWLAALDEGSVRKALANLKDNSEFRTLKDSAEARSRGDWLVGMNMSRAFTLAGRRSNNAIKILSVGRVQTPTLALVVNRDLAIEKFTPKPFYGVKLAAQAAMPFSANWKPSDEVAKDEAGRVLDMAVAKAVADKVKGQTAVVESYEATDKKQAAPLPYCLSTLQAAANKKFGMSAQDVLNIAQKLYEAKVTTYPRTDCSYLPESQFTDAANVLRALRGYDDLVAKADASLRSAAWNDAKVTAHHAIVPTGIHVELSGNEALIFDLIVRAFIAQFLPAYTYRQTNITLSCAGEKFTASGKTPLNAGWRAAYGVEDEEDKEKDGEDQSQTLPSLSRGETVQVLSADVISKMTTPPPRYTEGTLIQAMTNIHQFVEEPEFKKRLKETAGIGTEATRASIIETLKNRGFVAVKGKQLISTQLGRALVAILPPAVKNPGLTGMFEQALDAIVTGEITADQFIEKQVDFVKKYVAAAQQTTIAPEHFAGALAAPSAKAAGKASGGKPAGRGGKVNIAAAMARRVQS